MTRRRWTIVGTSEFPDDLGAPYVEGPDLAEGERVDVVEIQSEPEPAAREWYVCRYDNDELGPVGALSLLQCPECQALVLEDYLPEHRAWHACDSAADA